MDDDDKNKVESYDEWLHKAKIEITRSHMKTMLLFMLSTPYCIKNRKHHFSHLIPFPKTFCNKLVIRKTFAKPQKRLYSELVASTPTTNQYTRQSTVINSITELIDQVTNTHNNFDLDLIEIIDIASDDKLIFSIQPQKRISTAYQLSNTKYHQEYLYKGEELSSIEQHYPAQQYERPNDNSWFPIVETKRFVNGIEQENGWSCGSASIEALDNVSHYLWCVYGDEYYEKEYEHTQMDSA